MRKGEKEEFSWPTSGSAQHSKHNSCRALRTFFEQKNYARFRQHFSAVIER
jgi:hypothetical protein